MRVFEVWNLESGKEHEIGVKRELEGIKGAELGEH